jgi:UDP-N-acetylmuramyl pentapeptide phosphotransferase/UDP-N-acetylglucosamine-1-phosphate transferase
MSLKTANTPNSLVWLILPVVSLLVSFGLVYIYKRVAARFNIIDVPSQRSSHEVPTPRGGGLAIVITFIIFFPVVLYYFGQGSVNYWGVYFCSIAISALGFIDDLTTLSKKIRVLVWVVIAAVSIIAGISLNRISLPGLRIINFGIFNPFLTFIWLIGLTNLYNFMDGINGLAGLEALIVSGFLAGFAFYAGNMMILAVSLIIFGAVLGFLPYNFPNAKVFLGDVGSNFLGYIFASLAIIGNQGESDHIPFLIPVFLLMMFLLDGGTTLIRRLPKGRDWLEPHRDHFYQRLVLLGHSHSQVALLYSFLNILLGILAVYYLRSDGLSAWLVAICSIMPFLLVVMYTYLSEKK